MPPDSPNASPVVLSYASGSGEAELTYLRFKRSIRTGLIMILCATLVAPVASVAAAKYSYQSYLLGGVSALLAVWLHGLGIWFITVRPPPGPAGNSPWLRFFLRMFSALAAIGITLVLAGIALVVTRILYVPGTILSSCGAVLNVGWLPLPWMILSMLGSLARRIDNPSLARLLSTTAWAILGIPLLIIFLADISLMDWSYLGGSLLTAATVLGIGYLALLIELLVAYSKRD